MSRSSRRSDSRSREPSCDWRRDPQRDRDDRKRRTRSHSRSSSPQGIRRYSRANDGVNDGSYSKHEIQDIIDRKVAEDVQIAAQKRVDEYVKSEDFVLMVESFKRREREKVLLEVQHELESERELLLSEGRKSLASTVYTGDDIGKSCATAEYSGEYFSPEARADAILLQNKLKMEEEQRRIYNEKQKEEAERLAEVLSRKHLEDLIEQQRIESMQRHNEDLEHALDRPSVASVGDECSEQGHHAEVLSLPKSNSSTKLSFGLKKRNALC